MLTPDVARRQVEDWMSSQDNDDGQGRIVTAIQKMPERLRTIGYALFECDADGKEASRDDWKECVLRHRRSKQLDTLSVSERKQFFAPLLPNIADAAEVGWQFLKAAPYQRGYIRKSFRAPRHPEVTYPRRIDWLRHLIEVAARFPSDLVTLPWLAAWAPHLDKGYGGDQETIGRLLAAVIDAGGPLANEVFGILVDSVRNEHEIGAFGRHATRGLLLASREDGWELMEKNTPRRPKAGGTSTKHPRGS